MKPALLVLTVLTILLGLDLGRAHGQEIELSDSANYYVLRLSRGWQVATPAPGTETILAAYSNPTTEQHLAVTRVAFPNRAARRDRDRFFAEVEAGLRESTPGYELLDERRSRVAHVQILDLSFRHTPHGRAAEVVSIRFLFFRSFSLSLAVSGEASRYRRQRRATRALVNSFKPQLVP